MNKRVFALVLVFMLMSGVAVASSINGDFNGDAIVKVKSNGKTLPVEDAPGVLYHDRAMIPLYMLRSLGFDVQWNDAEFSVDVKPNGTQTNIKDVLAKTGGNLKYEAIGSSLYASADFTRKQNFDADWPIMEGILKALSGLNTDYSKINYIDKDKIIGTFTAKTADLIAVNDGKLSDEEMQNRWIITGDFSTKSPLSVKEIAKLTDRVAYVYAFDQNNQLLGQGSGFMITPGYFISNHHVAGDAGGMQIYLDHKVYNTFGEYNFKNKTTDVFGVVIATEHDKDKPWISTGGYPDKMLSYSTTLPEVGDKVFAIGSPLGLDNTVSEGIVSAVREINGITMIQHTCNTDHGSSGGVLLNEYGEAIGITSAGFDGTSLDFAVPMMYVQQEIDKQTPPK